MIFSDLALLFYVAALAFALIYGGFKQRALFAITLVAAGAGYVVQTLAIARTWAATGVPPAANLHQLFPLTAWAMMTLFLALFAWMRSRILVFFLMPVVTLAYLLGVVVPDQAVEAKPYYHTPWFAVHIFLLIFGMAFFFLSFIYASIFIMQDHSLKHRRAPSPLAIPSLEEAERWSSRLLLAGYPLFTVGMFSSILYGVLYGRKNDYHPGLLEGASLLAWLVLGIAGYGWLTAKVHPRKRSWLVVAGAAFSVLIILGIIWH